MKRRASMHTCTVTSTDTYLQVVGHLMAVVLQVWSTKDLQKQGKDNTMSMQLALVDRSSVPFWWFVCRKRASRCFKASDVLWLKVGNHGSTRTQTHTHLHQLGRGGTWCTRWSHGAPMLYPSARTSRNKQVWQIVHTDFELDLQRRRKKEHVFCRHGRC